MRATITQRQETGGVFGQRQEYYVDCAIELNDDERRLIKNNPNTLLKHVIAGGRDMSYGEFRWSPRSYSQGAPFVLVLLLAVGIPFLPRPVTDNLGSYLLWLSMIGYCIFNYFNDYKGFAPSDLIRVTTVLDKPDFSIYAKNKTEAESIAADVRKHLNEFDALLSAKLATV